MSVDVQGLQKVQYFDLGKGLLQNYKRLIAESINPNALRGYCYDMKNIYSDQHGTARKMRGYSKYNSTVINNSSTVITSGFDFKDNTGLQRTVITTNDGKVRLMDAVDCATELITGLTTGSSLVWNWAVFDNGTDIFAIGANGTDVIKTDGTAGGTAALTSPPSSPQWVSAWKNRVWIASGNNLYMSAVNDQDSWDTTNDVFPIVDDNIYGISGIIVYNDLLYVGKSDGELGSIYYLTHKIPTQTSTSAFSITKTPANSSWDNGNSIIELPSNELEFKATDDFYRLRGDLVYKTGGIYTEGYFNSRLGFDTINKARQLYFNSKKIKSEGLGLHIFPLSGTNNAYGLYHDYQSEDARWYPLTQMNFHCLFNFQSSNEQQVFAGGRDGFIYRINNTENFDGSAIDSEMKFLCDSLGSLDAIKLIKRIEFRYESVGKADITIGLSPNCVSNNEVTRTLTPSSSGDLWDEGMWDTAVWGDSGNIGYGYVEGAPHPDTGLVGLGEFKSIGLRFANEETSQPFNIHGCTIWFEVIGDYMRR